MATCDVWLEHWRAKTQNASITTGNPIGVALGLDSPDIGVTLGKSLSKWHLPHRVIVRRVYVCTYVHAYFLSHTRVHTHQHPVALQRSLPSGQLSHKSCCLCRVVPRQLWSGHLCLTPMPAHRVPSSLSLTFTPSPIWSSLGPLCRASLLQIPFAVMPVGLVLGIISEKARPDFVCLCLYWGVLIVFLLVCIDTRVL